MKGPRITLKRGVVINGGLAAWLDAIRAGNQTGRRQATVVLYNIQNQPVKSWRFTNAWATKWKGPALNAKGNDKSIEELVLSADNIEIVPIKK